MKTLVPSPRPESRPRSAAASRAATSRWLPIFGGLLVSLLLLQAMPASAQVEPDRLRFKWTSGVLLTGELGSSDFVLDTSPFGGARTERTGGWLDVDPSIWYGVETTWRFSDRLTVAGSWMHSRGRFRVQYPALATEEGTFDLEGLLLAGQDFNNAGTEVISVSGMNDALTDVLIASLTWELPLFRRWAFPFASVGAGLYKIKSDGNVIEVKYQGAEPTANEQLEIYGIDGNAAGGIATFSVDALDPVVSIGGGVRASISQRWGASIMFEDLIRIGADHSEIDSATGEVDPEQGRLIQTSFVGKKGEIHNVGIRIALNYAFWPSQRPR